ncbi:MAG: glutamate synthase (NADPH/NADH) small chain [Candidatus Omnitrophota bacterium]|jgi:glutamate synthase (NADPH/NADH) small chain
MGDIKGFMKHDRKDFSKKPVSERVKDYSDFLKPLEENTLRKQGSRCMDCGVPFCQEGCPIGNIIPDWNDLVSKGNWEEAIERLHKTNNFPEFTGRVCPAPCESACVLGINELPVTIKNMEVAIVERAYDEGWIKPQPPKHRINKKVAIIGSGPAGLACADQLNKEGYSVTVYEKNEVVGGLLTLGIPEFKLEKWIVERRAKRMSQEGVKFKTSVAVGIDVKATQLVTDYDSVVFCCGAEAARDLEAEGRDLNGIHFAMEFLTQQNRECLGQKVENKISAEGKNVIVIGGGDTGSDCIGTSNRQGAKSVVNLELMPKSPDVRADDNPWPNWAFIHRTSSSHEEGVEQKYAVMTKKFIGENGKLTKIQLINLEFGDKDPETGRRPMKEIEGSEYELDVDVVFLAMGFLGPVKTGLVEELGLELTDRGNVKADVNKMTNVAGVFTAGDMTRGQSLVVWAINEGRMAAKGVSQYLKQQISVA